MKQFASALLAALLLLTLTACGGPADTQPATLGQALEGDFLARAEQDPQADLETLAQDILANKALGFEGMVTAVEPGLLPGFGNTEITGFTQAVQFGPVISTIPFVGYLFQTESEAQGTALREALLEAADPRWNICTEADETLATQAGTTVFFLMCPSAMEG